MSFKTAKTEFDTAQKIAKESGDSYGEHLAAGLAALADILKSEVGSIKSKQNSIENKINGLR